MFTEARAFNLGLGRSDKSTNQKTTDCNRRRNDGDNRAGI
jgi:hypothetical protein